MGGSIPVRGYAGGRLSTEVSASASDPPGCMESVMHRQCPNQNLRGIHPVLGFLGMSRTLLYEFFAGASLPAWVVCGPPVTCKIPARLGKMADYLSPSGVPHDQCREDRHYRTDV